ncbi:proline dehydrogenase [Taxawa tesnikishii (nom. ined.)]|nr:proline dehydrogenase [Dothideales sp. JES 119]
MQILKSTFYAQYCCGENRQEIALTVSDLRRLGFTGVVLAYAKEGNPEEIQPRSSAENKAQMQAWLEGNLETVRLAERGDCIAVKYTGAGDNAIIALKALTRQDDGADHVPEIRSLREAMHQVCQAAKDKGVRVLMDAEQQVVQRGIDILSLVRASKPLLHPFIKFR